MCNMSPPERQLGRRRIGKELSLISKQSTSPCPGENCSRQDPFSLRIVGGLQEGFGGIWSAGNVDGIRAGGDEFGCDWLEMVDVAHGDGCAHGMTVGTGGGVSDRLAVPED